MPEQRTYCVYFHTQALDALGGKPPDVEVMVPTGMIRLVISTGGSEIDFGFT